MNKIIKKIVTIISPLLLLTLNILGSTFVSSSLHNLADKQYRQVTLSNKITLDNMLNSDILTNFGALPLDGNDEANFFPTDFIVKNLKRRFQQEIDITKIELFGLPNKELSDAGINKVIILQNKENLKDYNIDPTTIEFKKYQLFTSDKIAPNLTYIYPLEKLNLPLIDKDNNEYLHYAFIAPAAGGESWYSQFITYNSLDLQVDLNFKKPIQTESQKILTTFRSGELKDYEKLDVTDKIEEYL